MKRRSACLAVGLSLLLSAASAPAQIVGATPYGSPGLYETPLDPALFLQLHRQGTPLPELRLVGGFTGDPAVLMVSGAPAMTPLGNGATIYVGASMVPLVGVFGPTGEFAVPFSPAVPVLRGVTLYFQGVDVMLTGGLQLSNGMALTFESAN